MTGTSIAYKLIIFRPSTTDTMPLTTQISRTATKWLATSQKINRNMQHIHLIIRERSGSVVECMTDDREAAGSNLTGVTALWSLSKAHLSLLSSGSTQEDPSLFN